MMNKCQRNRENNDKNVRLQRIDDRWKSTRIELGKCRKHDGILYKKHWSSATERFLEGYWISFQEVTNHRL